MKIDLLDIFENNEEIKKEQEKINDKKELRNLVTAIINGVDEYYLNSKTLVDDLGVKYTTLKYTTFYPYFVATSYHGNGKYKVKLNKTNIKLIQKYLDKEEK